MRPTREGRTTPQRAGLVTVGVGVNPDDPIDDPADPTDRASSAENGQAFIPFLPPPSIGATIDLNLDLGTDYDGGGIRPVVTPTNANDGDLTTQAYRASYFNASGTDTWWVEADLGSAHQVDSIVIRGGFGNSGENDPPFVVEHSPDSSTWTTAVGAYTWDGATNPRTATLVLTASQTKRYWRVGQNVTWTGLIFPVKVHTFALNGPQTITPSSVLTVEAPMTIDDNNATYENVLEDSVDAATDNWIWRAILDDAYLIASINARIGFENAGSVTVVVQAGNADDYSDAATIATLTATATGSMTADVLSGSWTPTAVYRYWQLLLTTTPQDLNIYEVSLFDPPEFTGAHGDLTGRDEVDQHPADAVTVSPTVAGASDVQAALEGLEGLIGTGNFEKYNDGGEPLSQDHSTLGATETIDATNGNHQRGTLDQNCTITVAPFDDGSIEVVIYQNGTGGWDITWSGVDFGGGDDQPDQAASSATVYTFLSDDGTIYGFKAGGGSTLVIDDGVTTVDPTETVTFVGSGAATVDVTDGGGGAATVTVTVEEVDTSGDHEHVIDVFNGDASTTAFEISNEPFDPEQVFAFVGGSWTAVTMSGGLNTIATFGSPPGSGTGNVVIQYPAVVA